MQRERSCWEALVFFVPPVQAEKSITANFVCFTINTAAIHGSLKGILHISSNFPCFPSHLKQFPSFLWLAVVLKPLVTFSKKPVLSIGSWKWGGERSFPLATQAFTCLPVLLKSHIWKKSAERDVRTEPHVYNISKFNLSSTLEPSAQLLAASYMS